MRPFHALKVKGVAKPDITSDGVLHGPCLQSSGTKDDNESIVPRESKHSISISNPPSLPRMYITVYVCTSLCTYVHHCVRMYITVYVCTSLCTYVHHCVRMYITVYVSQYPPTVP